jgi:hypothetical protein
LISFSRAGDLFACHSKIPNRNTAANYKYSKKFFMEEFPAENPTEEGSSTSFVKEAKELLELIKNLDSHLQSLKSIEDGSPNVERIITIVRFYIICFASIYC